MRFAERQGILRCLPFDEYGWQEHGFGGRQANPVASITLRQIHSANVLVADGLTDREAEGDALMTDTVDLAIGVRTADCVPILMLDRATRAVAAVHAGWRGTAAEIASQTVAKFAGVYGSKPGDLYAAIGPCIRACCYEVSVEVAQQFERWRETVEHSRGAKPHVDLAAANRAQLTDAGMNPANLFDCGLCTACHLDRFFSYRREPDNPGRMRSAIVRTG